MSEKIQGAIDFLNHNPWVGAGSGFGSWALLNINFFTDPANLSMVAIFAAWCGAFVALLTALLKMAELCEKVWVRIRK